MTIPTMTFQELIDFLESLGLNRTDRLESINIPMGTMDIRHMSLRTVQDRPGPDDIYEVYSEQGPVEQP